MSFQHVINNKFLLRYFMFFFFHMKSSKSCVVYTESTSPFTLNTSRVLRVTCERRKETRKVGGGNVSENLEVPYKHIDVSHTLSLAISKATHFLVVHFHKFSLTSQENPFSCLVKIYLSLFVPTVVDR